MPYPTVVFKYMKGCLVEEVFGLLSGAPQGNTGGIFFNYRKDFWRPTCAEHTGAGEWIRRGQGAQMWQCPQVADRFIAVDRRESFRRWERPLWGDWPSSLEVFRKRLPGPWVGTRRLTLVEQGSDNYRPWAKSGFLLSLVNSFIRTWPCPFV